MANWCLRVGFMVSLLSLLAACGFTPVAGQKNAVALPQVSVQVHAGGDLRILAGEFTSRLEDLLGQAPQRPDRVKLIVSLTHSTSAGLIAPDGKAQRYTMTLQSSYTLVPEGKMDAIDVGSIARSGSYLNRPNVYFSTFVSEQDTIKRLSRELAEEYHLLLVSRLGSPVKLEKHGVTPPETPPKRGIVPLLF